MYQDSSDEVSDAKMAYPVEESPTENAEKAANDASQLALPPLGDPRLESLSTYA